MFTGSKFSKFNGGGTSNQYYNNRHRPCAIFADSKFCTKFMKQVKENDYKNIRKLVKKGFDVNGPQRFDGDTEKMTAIHFAAKEGMVQMVKELLSCECDVNVTTAFDLASPLHFACDFHDQDVALIMAEDLVNAGTSVNALDHAEKSSLIIASEHGNLALVRVLLKAGAEVDHKYQSEDYPSSIYQAMNFVSQTPPDADEVIDAYSSNTALIQACRAHHFPVVKELVRHGADLNIANGNGNTALHIACQSQCKDVYSDKLTRAPIAGHSAIVKFLIESGSNLDAKNSFTDTPLKRTLDGIRSFAHWTYPIEDRIEECLKLFEIAQILLHSGCNVSGHYTEVDYGSSTPENMERHYRTALHYLLAAAISAKDFSVRLHHKFLLCLRLFLAAGCTIDTADLEMCKDLRIPPALVDTMIQTANQPSSLKKLCNMSIRRLLHKPLTANVTQLGLPQILTRLVSLEIVD